MHNVQVQIAIWKVIPVYKETIPIATDICNDIQQESISDIEKRSSRITSPPFSHGQLYIALSRAQDYNNIALYVNDEQLIDSDVLLTDYMPTVNNIVCQDVLALNCVNNDIHDNSAATDNSSDNLN
jgi:hypothetical protein